MAFTADLVRAPSLMGNEAGAQNLMDRGMRELGLKVDRWRLDAAGFDGSMMKRHDDRQRSGRWPVTFGDLRVVDRVVASIACLPRLGFDGIED